MNYYSTNMMSTASSASRVIDIVPPSIVVLGIVVPVARISRARICRPLTAPTPVSMLTMRRRRRRDGRCRPLVVLLLTGSCGS